MYVCIIFLTMTHVFWFIFVVIWVTKQNVIIVKNNKFNYNNIDTENKKGIEIVSKYI